MTTCRQPFANDCQLSTLRLSGRFSLPMERMVAYTVLSVPPELWRATGATSSHLRRFCDVTHLAPALYPKTLSHLLPQVLPLLPLNPSFRQLLGLGGGSLRPTIPRACMRWVSSPRDRFLEVAVVSVEFPRYVHPYLKTGALQYIVVSLQQNNFFSLVFLPLNFACA